MTYPIISCPLDCLPAFAEVGSYYHPAINQVFREDAIFQPRITDVGANVGAFSIWAAREWPKASVSAFEPNSKLFPILKENLKSFPSMAYNVAITTETEPILWNGNDTALCSSLKIWDRANSSYKRCEPLHPSKLSPCDFLKIDCEGSEADILENITFVPAFLALEWHSDELRIRCEKAMAGKMTLVESKVSGYGFGLLKFIRVRK